MQAWENGIRWASGESHTKKLCSHASQESVSAFSSLLATQKTSDTTDGATTLVIKITPPSFQRLTWKTTGNTSEGISRGRGGILRDTQEPILTIPAAELKVEHVVDGGRARIGRSYFLLPLKRYGTLRGEGADPGL